ncbi:phosphoadenosine phosphosulfate reductase [Pyrolobus fumarii 1A]|uniref:Phosphoadenosine phosphosulfate reductase n=1 Tax=Pyrolobus fumarii (strain DSM 11204 / 1A) TaxID=694429 RepID=G0EH67_PYRF1|nr:phosphoadenosine phosphosulfate reductase family protein [Pyrolobus fumarii]AEM39291.1 phosphoadenosine phosphosulfate reductase [Pyrolobus fumarii 1A]
MSGVRTPRIYWCTCGDGMPAIDPRVCLECGGEAVEVYGVRGDPMPMTDGVWKWVREAIAWSLDVDESVAQRLAPGGAGLRVKLDAVEVAYALVYGGGWAGVIEFDWEVYRWVFSPRGWLASLVYREKLGNVGRLEVRAARGDILPWTVYHGVRSDKIGARIVARDVAGRIVVLRVEKGGLRVEWVEAYREDAEWPKPADWRRMYDLHWRVRVERMFREAVEWSEKVLREYGPGVVRLSGGKDSSVAALVFAEAGGEHAVFSDTGWEHKETIETAERVAETIGVNLDVVEPPRDCWRLLEGYGPPGRDYRWCTQACKLGPTARYIEERGFRTVFAGNRALESPSRARESRLSRSRGAGGGEFIASPLHAWTSLDVYTAVVTKRLPLNPLYEYGIERVGCFNCPSQSIPELQLSARLSPDKWERWSSFLKRYAEERDLPNAWLRYHLWRWRFNPPPRVRVATRDLLGVRWDKLIEKLYVTRVLEVGTEVPSVRLFNPLGGLSGLSDLRGVAPALGAVWEVTQHHLVVKPSRYSMVVFYQDGEVYVEGGSWEEIESLAEEAIRAIAMSAACTGCMLCVKKCPHDAINVIDGHRPVVDQKKCIACRKCLYVCPVAGYALLSQKVGLQKTIEEMLEGG